MLKCTLTERAIRITADPVDTQIAVDAEALGLVVTRLFEDGEYDDRGIISARSGFVGDDAVDSTLSYRGVGR